MSRKIFGTDGIRGKANLWPMTPELALQLGKAVTCVLTGHKPFRKRFAKKGGFRHKHNGARKKILIGKDTRLSGYMLETALTSGIVAMGSDVLLLGPMPTPAIAHLTKSLGADAGIVLSASHNPAEDNGIKIFNSEGYKLDDKLEEKIEKHLLSKAINAEHIKSKQIGKAFRIDDAKGRYIEFCKASIGNMQLNGLKIVLDCANGAAYSVAPTILRELGADVIALNNKPDGTNINNGCGATCPEIIQKAVRHYKANLGLALDGDADRLIVCDETAEIVDGDFLLAMFAKELKEHSILPQNTVVTTVMSNFGFHEAMEKLGIKVVVTKVGDRYVIDAMRKGNFGLGGEQSGHIIFGGYTTTGDGIIAALQLLRIMKTKGRKLSKLKNLLRKYPQKLINLKVKQKKPFEKIPTVCKLVAEAEQSLHGKGRVLLRYSGTENLARVMVEAKSRKDVEHYSKKLANAIKKSIGA